MKKIKLILLFFPIFIFNATVQNIFGTWNGKLYQDAGGVRSEYIFKMELNQTGDEISGSIKGNIFSFIENKIISQNPEHMMYWCIKIIEAGKFSKKIILRSDLNQSDMIYFEYEK